MRFSDLSAEVFERLARRQVEREFATLPPDARELPYTVSRLRARRTEAVRGRGAMLRTMGRNRVPALDAAVATES